MNIRGMPCLEQILCNGNREIAMDHTHTRNREGELNFPRDLLSCIKSEVFLFREKERSRAELEIGEETKCTDTGMGSQEMSDPI